MLLPPPCVFELHIRIPFTFTPLYTYRILGTRPQLEVILIRFTSPLSNTPYLGRFLFCSASVLTEVTEDTIHRSCPLPVHSLLSRSDSTALPLATSCSLGLLALPNQTFGYQLSCSLSTYHLPRGRHCIVTSFSFSLSIS